MAGPNPKRQKNAREQLCKLVDHPDTAWIIHYSCESFYNRTDGSTPRITSIAVRNLANGQTHSFSIHQFAELEHIDITQISNHYDKLEKKMLESFFDFIKSHQGAKYIHWNMRDLNYGFPAIAHRLKVLGGNPSDIQDTDKFDLARILIDIYGTNYTDHPRIESLMAQNNIKAVNFLSGAKEAEAFNRKDFVALHQSTLRKVNILEDFMRRAHDNRLKTKATWWEVNGGNIRGTIMWLDGHPIAKILTIVAAIITILGVLIAL